MDRCTMHLLSGYLSILKRCKLTKLYHTQTSINWSNQTFPGNSKTGQRGKHPCLLCVHVHKVLICILWGGADIISSMLTVQIMVFKCFYLLSTEVAWTFYQHPHTVDGDDTHTQQADWSELHRETQTGPKVRESTYLIFLWLFEEN